MLLKQPFYFILIISTLLLASCSGGAPIPTAAPLELPTLPPTEAPTLTPLPAATRVLVANGGQLPEVDVQQVMAQALGLGGATGLTVELVPQLTAEMLTPDVKLAIVLPPDPGVTDVASRYPGIRFITIAIPGITPSANLFTIGADGAHPEWPGFVAGYIAAITTYEWRVGALTQTGSNDGLLAGDAFRNGAMFFCGLCNPYFTPFTDYPIAMEMNPAPTQAEWQPWADAFIASGVKTAYVYPGVANPEMLAYLAQKGLKLIGGQLPSDELRPAWIASINLDYSSPLEDVWSEVMGDTPGRDLPVGIKLGDIDASVLGDGKLRLVNEIIALLTSGAIAPNTVQ
ncbi:MAG: hypothetical protein C0391_01530 [Anaerolinea sp.]|nr:hypothetical protein [Anaerolinea sp.]